MPRVSNSFKTGAFLFSILCASATFAGCGDDDDDATPTNTAGQGGEPSNSGGSSSGSGGKANQNQAGDSNAAGDTSAGGSPSQAGNGGGGEATAGGAAGAGGAGPELACTQLEYGDAVFAEYVTTAQPDPEGGTPANGTYQLTKLTHYGSAQASTSNDPIHSALKIAGNVLEWANQAKEEEETRGSFTFTVDDTDLALTKVCPSAGAGDGTPFTADGDTIILYLDAEYTYTK